MTGDPYRDVADDHDDRRHIRSRAPAIMKKLCREVFKTAKIPLSPRGPQLEVMH